LTAQLYQLSSEMIEEALPIALPLPGNFGECEWLTVNDLDPASLRLGFAPGQGHMGANDSNRQHRRAGTLGNEGQSFIEGAKMPAVTAGAFRKDKHGFPLFQ
jgi:hypothetical protein